MKINCNSNYFNNMQVPTNNARIITWSLERRYTHYAIVIMFVVSVYEIMKQITNN